MAGAYCKFCNHRCFVERVIPGGPQKGWTGHLATCARGKEYDRTQTGGYDADTAVNPVTQPQTARVVRQLITTDTAIAKAVDNGQLRLELILREQAEKLQRRHEELRERGEDVDPDEDEDEDDDPADDPDAMESMYPRDREDGEGIHRPSYGE